MQEARTTHDREREAFMAVAAPGPGTDPSMRPDRCRALLVDDEAACRARLAHLLELHCPQVQIVAECATVAEALAAMPGAAPDLVFLDIMLPDGTGFDLLQRLGAASFKVVFTTAHDQFAIRAIRLSALDYLLKPVSSAELIAAVGKIDMRDAEPSTQPAQIALLHTNLAQHNDDDMQITLPTLDGFLFLPVRDLVCCEAESNYTKCCTASGETVLVSRTLKEFEELLAGHRFVRIHHSHMINLRHLRRYVRGKGGYVVLTGGRELEVSVRRKEEFVRAIGG